MENGSIDPALRASPEWKETCAQPGYRLGLRVLAAARNSAAFRARATKDPTPSLRSLLEVRCFRRAAPDEWWILVVPFARELISVRIDEMDRKSRLALLALVLRRGDDGFSRTETRDFGNEVRLRDFVHDARLTRFLDLGLEALMFAKGDSARDLVERMLADA